MRRILDLGPFRRQFDRLGLEMVPGVPELVLSDVVVPCLVLGMEEAGRGGGLVRFERVSLPALGGGVFTVLTVPVGMEWAIIRMSVRRLTGNMTMFVSVGGPGVGLGVALFDRFAAVGDWDSPNLVGLNIGAGMRIMVNVVGGSIVSDFEASVLFREIAIAG